MREARTQGSSATWCDVSIVIVNWNAREYLRNCLESIVAHTQQCTFEIIIVDNASTDGTPADT